MLGLSRKIRSGAKFGPGGPIIAADFGPVCKNRSVCMCAFIGTFLDVYLKTLWQSLLVRFEL